MTTASKTNYSFTEKKRIRKDFGKRKSILEVPFLLAISRSTRIASSCRKASSPPSAKTGACMPRLAFDYQSQLAARLKVAGPPNRRASELLMQRYYRAAKRVQLANEILLPALQAQLMRESVAITPLDENFALHGNLLGLRDPELFQSDPSAIFRAFISAMRHGVSGFEPATLRALWRARTSIDQAFRSNPKNRAQFLALLREPQGVSWAFAAMSRYGILGRYLPAFGRITGQMQHDGFHIYTVDEHTLATPLRTPSPWKAG